jgi:hypothetical protein
MTPWGAVVLIRNKLRQIAKNEDLVSLEAYIASAEFKSRLVLAADHCATIMASCEKAKRLCVQREAVPRKGTRRAEWNERMIARFIEAWETHRNDRRVARELGITEGAAYRARRRYVDHATRNNGNPPSSAQDSRAGLGRSQSAPVSGAAATPPQAA